MKKHFTFYFTLLAFFCISACEDDEPMDTALDCNSFQYESTSLASQHYFLADSPLTETEELDLTVSIDSLTAEALSFVEEDFSLISNLEIIDDQIRLQASSGIEAFASYSEYTLDDCKLLEVELDGDFFAEYQLCEQGLIHRAYFIYSLQKSMDEETYNVVPPVNGFSTEESQTLSLTEQIEANLSSAPEVDAYYVQVYNGLYTCTE